MVKTAVILAAGLGSRLKDRTKEKPKGFLEIGGKTIIEQSVRKLIESGIENIFIGTGYLYEKYEEFARNFYQITCRFNPDYAVSGSLYTLYNMKELIKDDFLLLESDLLYDKTGLKVLLNDFHKDVILASGYTNSNDEVFIETDEEFHLIQVSKIKDNLMSIYGELVGISKISYPAFTGICNFVEKEPAICKKMDYESALAKISILNIQNNTEPFYVKKIQDYSWCEIDDEEHLERARSKIHPLICEKESLLSVKRNVLLNPGPATTTDSVKYAQVAPDICPREKEFGDLMEFVSMELTSIVADTKDYATVLFGGSGTAAMEAMLSSVVGEDIVLIINNGAYGERMCRIAEVYGINYQEFKSPPDNAVDLVELESFIKKTFSEKRKISHLFVVHHETTTGLLNDVTAIGKICGKYGIILLVDGISSFAAIPVDMKAMNISFMTASSNKNIQGMAGLSFIIANRSLIEKTKSIKMRNYYLNLYKQYEYFEKTHQTRFTPPVQTFYALRQAIIEAKTEGIENRYKRYTACWEVLINGLKRLNLKYIVPLEHQSKMITAILEPDYPEYDFEKMHDYFYNKGFTIYPGKISKAKTFRIANIGEMFAEDMERFVGLLGNYLSVLKKRNSQ